MPRRINWRRNRAQVARNVADEPDSGRLHASSAVFLSVNPSGYVESQGAFTRRFASEMQPRLKPLIEVLPHGAEVVATLRRMLSYQPAARPSLQEIAE